jgi:hypothetical protein
MANMATTSFTSVRTEADCVGPQVYDPWRND